MMTAEGSERCEVAAFEDRGGGVMNQGMQEPLETGKGKETVSSLRASNMEQHLASLYTLTQKLVTLLTFFSFWATRSAVIFSLRQ